MSSLKIFITFHSGIRAEVLGPYSSLTWKGKLIEIGTIYGVRYI